MPFFHSHHHHLFYREQGSGELLLILSGNTASSALHKAELEYFGRRFHAAALDFLGTGQSERLATWPQDWWQQGARDALTLVDHLGAREAIFMGTSGGAVAALWAAILAPRACPRSDRRQHRRRYPRSSSCRRCWQSARSAPPGR